MHSALTPAQERQCIISKDNFNEFYAYFYTPGSDDSKHRCRKCEKEVAWKSKSGYTNAKNHLCNLHPEWKAEWINHSKAENSEKSGIFKFANRTVSEDAISLHKWIVWIIEDCLPFSFVESKNTRHYTSIGTWSRTTLVSVMQRVGLVLDQNLRNVIPYKFGIIFDSWTCPGTSEHYTAIFATWSTQGRTSVCVGKVLLGCGVQDDPDGTEALAFGAEDYGDIIINTLRHYDKDLSNVQFMTGDNCSVNQSLATRLKIPLVGCASHRLNLAARLLYAEPQYAPVIEKISKLMQKLSTLVNSSYLRRLTSLHPIKHNDTRWSSMYAMLKRYKKLRPYITRANGFPEDVLDLTLSEVEEGRLTVLMDILENVSQCSMQLQNEGCRMFHVRAYFNILKEKYPLFAQHLSEDSRIVHSPVFERAIVKLQKDEQIDSRETGALTNFRINPSVDQNAPTEEGNEKECSNEFVAVFNEMNEQLTKRQKQSSAHLYLPADHVQPTSNDCERLFSRAKIYSDDRRKRLSPHHLELMMQLYYNRPYWNAFTVDEALRMENSNRENELLDEEQING